MPSNMLTLTSNWGSYKKNSASLVFMKNMQKLGTVCYKMNRELSFGDCGVLHRLACKAPSSGLQQQSTQILDVLQSRETVCLHYHVHLYHITVCLHYHVHLYHISQ